MLPSLNSQFAVLFPYSQKLKEGHQNFFKRTKIHASLVDKNSGHALGERNCVWRQQQYKR